MGLDFGLIYLMSTVIEIILYIVSYVFKSIAIYVLSKRNGFKNLFLAFIPFLNFILVGKLIGKMILWGKPIKNIGVWVCIFSALEFIVGIFYSFEFYVEVLQEVLELITQGTVTINNSFVIFLTQNVVVYYVLEIVYAIVSIGKIFFNVSMMFALFKKYVPQKYFLYGFLSIFFEFMFGFLLFSLRKKDPMTEEDYYREMARKRGYYVYRVNPNDFNNPYNPYNQQRPQQKTQEEDPFPEFDSDNKGGESSQNGDSKADDLFD